MMVYLLKILYFVYHNVLWDNICNYGLHKHRCYLDECTILISRYILIYGVLINLLQDHDNASSCPPVTHSMGSWIRPGGHPCCTHHLWIHVRHMHIGGEVLSWWLMLAIKTSIIFYGFCWSLTFVANELGTWLENMLEIVWNVQVHVHVINLLYILKTSFSIVFKINFVDNHNFITFTNFLIFISWFISLLNTCESLWIRNKQKKYSLWKKSIQQYIMLTWIS